MVEDFVRASGYLSLGSRLRRIGERLQGDVGRLLQSEGINVPAAFFPAMKSLQLAGSLTVGELAEAIGIAQPGVTRSLAQMEALGLVKSVRGKKDARQRRVSLTPKGDALLTRTDKEIWPLIGQSVAAICETADGPLLRQLDHLEAELVRIPLEIRVAKHRKEIADATSS